MMYKITTLPAWVMSLAFFTPLLLGNWLESVMMIGVYFIAILGILWAFSVGKLLNDRMPAKKKWKFNIYRIAVIYTGVYFMSIPLFLLRISHEMIPIIIPGNLLFFSSLIWSIYFISKCIVTIRNRNESLWSYLLGLYFFPIGIWFIQPKIYKIITEKSSIQHHLRKT